jgi:hypothetical protein
MEMRSGFRLNRATAVVAAAVAGLAVPWAANAANLTWDLDPLTPGNWNTATNWSTDTVPTSADSTRFTAGGIAQVDAASDTGQLLVGNAGTSTNTVQVLPGGSLAVGTLGASQLAGGADATANLTMTGGSVSIASASQFDVARFGIATVDISGGATLNTGGSLRAGVFEQNGQGTINLSNGTINVGTGGSGSFQLNGGASNAAAQTRAPFGKFFQTGGTVNVPNGNMLVGGTGTSLTADGEALYELGAGTLNAGGLQINSQPNAASTFRVTNAAASINLVGNLQLGGNAVYEAPAGTVINFTGVTGSTGAGAYAGLNVYHINTLGLADTADVLGLSNTSLVFAGGDLGASLIGNYEVAGADLGATLAGFTNNFDLAGLSIGQGATVGNLRLVDLTDNGSATEALYVDVLNVTAGSTLDLNGLNLYYQSGAIDGSVINGSATLVPEPTGLALLALGGVAAAGIRRRRSR